MTKTKKKAPKLRQSRWDCVLCGLEIPVDEDGCCACCGRQAIPFVRGVPDYRGVLASMEADDAELEALRVRVRTKGKP